MKKVTFSKYDTAEIIKDKKHAIAFLEFALEENDPKNLLRIVDAITRSKAMIKIAKQKKLDYKDLYESLSPDGNPSFETIFKLLDILKLRIKLAPKNLPTRSEAIAK
jgi:probable addiction module antidote protein